MAIDIFVYCFTKFQLGHTSPEATFHDGVGSARLRQQLESNGMGLIYGCLAGQFQTPLKMRGKVGKSELDAFKGP